MLHPESICKPDPVYPVKNETVINLGQLLPDASSGLPRSEMGNLCTSFDRRTLLVWPCIGWGLPSQLVAKLLVSSYLTVSSLPLDRDREAVCFLLHFPSDFSAWSLTSILPYDVRTFLDMCHHTARQSNRL